MEHHERYRTDSPSMPPVFTRTRSHQSIPIQPDYNSVHTSFETVQVSEEAPWDKQGEDLLRSWLETAKQQASVHRKQGFKLKYLYKFFGILTIISAGAVFLFSNIKLSSMVATDDAAHVFVAFVNLIVVNLNNFLEYGPKYQRQFEFEGKYSKLAVDLEEILAIDSEFRSPKDRTLAENKEKFGNLLVNAPEA